MTMTKQTVSPGENPLDYALLKRLCQAFGPSGSEEEVSSLIREAVSPYCDRLETDSMGNLLALRHGNGKKIMVAAHMDEIGLMVTHIDEKGFLRFTAVGAVRIFDLPYRRVRLKNGRGGTIGLEKLEKISDIALSKLYIDIGVSSRAQAEENVRVGDMLVFVGDYEELGSRVMSKALDDRIGCFVAIEALKRTKSEQELAFAFTVQEELGARGARVAAFALSPDLGLAVDATSTGDTPEAPRMDVRLGAGVGIKVLDHSLVTPPRIKRWMAATAENRGIDYQWEVLEKGGTDSGAIHLTKGGIPAGTVSIPMRRVHSPSEMVDRHDVEAAVALLSALLEENDGI
ncbi:Peptidase M42, domain 2 [Acididesulfobacillus acetoxydans]|uniref:Peptidase M42, domain 2 n=2 Tax=Acididesulfobacillus acetoxydans TaxID=1561005 RepID=A0A8S0VXG9_9FIRM|nr:Peptidase M42, domain 2 [Acididesulfobacillus acetoxydans]CEJ08273.1 Tetrahedral aminopeptidase [Acididesulfobacillus acetoxydans]